MLFFCSGGLSAATFRTSAAGGSTSGTSNRTVAITPAINDLFVVFCAVAGNSNDSPSVTDDNGGTYTLVATPQNYAISAVNYRLSAHVRNSLLPNTTSTTVTCGTGSNTSGAIHVFAISGMARTGAAAIRQSSGQNNQAAGTPAPSFSANAVNDNLTIGAVANGTNPAGMTTPTNWTERQDTGFSSDALGLETISRDSGFTSTAITWGNASASQFCSLIIELDVTPTRIPRFTTQKVG